MELCYATHDNGSNLYSVKKLINWRQAKPEISFIGGGGLNFKLAELVSSFTQSLISMLLLDHTPRQHQRSSHAMYH